MIGTGAELFSLARAPTVVPPLSTHHKHTCKLCNEPSHSSQRELNLDADEEETLKACQLPHV
jgi:hypothetical protein